MLVEKIFNFITAVFDIHVFQFVVYQNSIIFQIEH